MNRVRFDYRLIEEIKKNDILYNVEHKDYRHVTKKNNVWAAIAKNLCVKNTEYCRKRWKSLRDTYKKSKRTEQLRLVRDEYHRKKWKFHDKMTFMDNYMDHRTGLKNIFEMCEFEDEEDESMEKEFTNEDKFDESFETDDVQIKEENKSDTQTEFPTEYLEELVEVENMADDDYIDGGSDIQSIDLKDDSFRSPPRDQVVDSGEAILAEHMAGKYYQNSKTKQSIYLLFESLASKIVNSNLTESQINTIELKVTTMVYNEISKSIINKVPEKSTKY